MSKVTIKSADASFRRAGIEFTRDGIEVDTDALSDEQVQAINDEPRLSVVGAIDVADGDESSKKPKLAKTKKAGK